MIPGLREKIHARVSPNDPPFRFRGAEPTRTEALCDAVIGFAITLAVVSLEVPRDSGDLLVLMRGFASFLVTFASLFAVWFSHARFCRRYGIEDDRTMWLTAAILFVVVFYTYPLKFVMAWLVDARVGLTGPHMADPDVPWIVSAYSLGLMLLAILFWALHRHALSLRDLLQLDPVEVEETRLTASTWLNSALVAVPLILTPVITIFPRRTPERRMLAIAYIVFLLAFVARFYWRVFVLMRERRQLAARARAAAPAVGLAGSSTGAA